MRNRRSSFSSGAAALAAVVALAVPWRAFAQACCAGGSAITPARLALHEDALVGLQARAGSVIGSYQLSGNYLPQRSGDTELDFEQDLFAALRVLPRGQVALLAPLVETRRATPLLGAQLGGGIGDVNVSGRYDFVVAGESRVVPGIALLAGLTLPTGRPPESAAPPLLSNATGIGAFQLNAALALEQAFGSWLLDATGIVAKRTDHGGETLGTQVTLLAAGAYVFDNDAALALSAAYAFEGDASCTSGPACPSGGADVPNSAKSVTTLTLSGLWPVSDAWRLLGGVYVNPPVSSVGVNQPAVAGITYTLVRTWI
jgi:hypothetical protein